jgi:hypothetical protein
VGISLSTLFTFKFKWGLNGIWAGIGGAFLAQTLSLVGLYKLNAVDPQLATAWFQPLSLWSENLVSMFAFKCNLYRYSLGTLVMCADFNAIAERVAGGNGGGGGGGGGGEAIDDDDIEAPLLVDSASDARGWGREDDLEPERSHVAIIPPAGPRLSSSGSGMRRNDSNNSLRNCRNGSSNSLRRLGSSGGSNSMAGSLSRSVSRRARLSYSRSPSAFTGGAVQVDSS